MARKQEYRMQSVSQLGHSKYHEHLKDGKQSFWNLLFSTSSDLVSDLLRHDPRSSELWKLERLWKWRKYIKKKLGYKEVGHVRHDGVNAPFR
jgi:hypothetical protein